MMDLLFLTGIIFTTIIFGLLAGMVVGYCMIILKKWWINKKYKKSVTPFSGVPCSIKLQDKDIIELEMLPDNYFSFGRMSESWQFTYDDDDICNDDEDDDDEKNLFSGNYKILKNSFIDIEKKEKIGNQEKWIGESKSSGQSFL
ncbi:Hypothetical protein SRAE_1000072900 [Strongyloides ratti]|uniref:Uncharacterized protein n=1 Tax=Strongyloides ratti TaxID=34506 RepID=A0A090KYD7_STRRB|nr:Hypothetical protein SRAE_1000072900 [Strongyloides ratti]CEF62456.1 Hypothetical protein SRAE_1000072900 [Strongyloides ratti]